MSVRTVGVVHGVPFAVEAPADLQPQVERLLPPGWRPRPEGSPVPLWRIRPKAGGWRVDQAGGRSARAVTAEAALLLMAGDLGLRAAAEAHDLIAVHAGVVGWHNHAILLPGRTLAGKSTLVAELVSRGATYYSDEYALIDQLGMVHAYPRLIRLRARGDARPGRPTTIAAAHVGSLPPVAVGVIAGLRYDSVSGWAVRPTGPAESILMLLADTLAARTRSAQALEHLAAAVRSARIAFTGTRDEAGDAAVRLLRSGPGVLPERPLPPEVKRVQ